MIINGGSRSNGSFFSTHLMRADHNEQVEVVEIRGLSSTNIRDAFREMKAIASGTRCSNYFYHANINTRDDEQLSPEQWQLAVDTLERELGLTEQPRFVVQHVKEGRTHQHIVWGRIDPFTMTAISDSLTYPKHERAARELETIFGHEPVQSVLVKNREGERPERNPKDWESLRAQDSKLDPKAIRTEVTALWHASDSGTAFAAALQEQGYILTRGDRRDFCIIDRHGDEHSLARRLSGIKAAEVREFMADVEREKLPSVAEGREQARLSAESSGDGAAPTESLEGTEEAQPADADAVAPKDANGPRNPAEELNALHDALIEQVAPAEEGEGGGFQAPEAPATPDDELQAVHQSLVDEMQAEGSGPEEALLPHQAVPETDLQAVHNQTIASAMAGERALQREEAANPGGRLERLRQWWGGMQVKFSDWRDHLSERFDQFRDRWQQREPLASAEPEPTKPTTESPSHEPEL